MSTYSYVIIKGGQTESPLPVFNQTDFGLVTVVPSSPPSPAPTVSDIPEFWGIVPIIESRNKQEEEVL